MGRGQLALTSWGWGWGVSRALGEESKARVLAPALLCDLRQAANFSGPQSEGEKSLGSSWLTRKQQGGVGPSFHFFIFSTTGLNENQLQRQRTLL